MRDRELFETEIGRLLPVEAYAQSEGEVDEQVHTGTTLYLPIELNASIPKKVGVYVPVGAGVAPTVDVIVYFHGHIIADCKNVPKAFKADGMNHYWNSPYFLCLRRDLAASGHRAVLIAPTMDPFVGANLGARGYGNLDEDHKFDFLVNETLRLLRQGSTIAKDAKLGNIVLAGHSGGGLPMQAVLHAVNKLRPKIRACWGFETLYFDRCPIKAWLKRDSTLRYRHFRRPSFKQDRVNEFKAYPNFIDTPKATDHCKSVEQFWSKALATMPQKPGSNVEYEFEDAPRPAPRAPSNSFALTDAALLSTPIKLSASGDKDAFDSAKKKLAANPALKLNLPKFVQVQQAPAVFLVNIVRRARELARAAGKTAIASVLDPDQWFKQFTRIRFLGRDFKPGDYVHTELAKKLQAIETSLVASIGGTPKQAGDVVLNNSSEGISGSRKSSSTAVYSMHMFGLAVDVNYLGNPYIESAQDIRLLNRALANASALLRGDTLSYSRPGNRDAYDELARLDALLEQYFALLDDANELRSKVGSATRAPWKGMSEAAARTKLQEDFDKLAQTLARGVTRKRGVVTRDLRPEFKKFALMDFDKRFVQAMTSAGLTWGASYGDIMHFDLRSGAGKYINQARGEHSARAMQQRDQLLRNKQYGYHEFVD